MTPGLNTSWLKPFTLRRDARIRLFCSPHAGAGAAVYRAWPDNLPATVEVCPVLLPGRESRIREAPFTRLTELVPALYRGLSPSFDKPFVFFGHSMGGLLAFELARWLRRQSGPRPLHIFVSARRAPQLPISDPPIHDLPRTEFLQKVSDLNGMARATSACEELLDIALPILRADFAMCESYTYSPEAPLDCPITAFGGTEDGDVGQWQIEAWRVQTTGTFVSRMFRGDHFFIETCRQSVLKQLGDELHRIAGSLP
jgi:medium-chain acyl-[acyl-carrier-protein] hydrolase